LSGTRSADEAWIVETVRKFADKAGIGMPEVGIFEGDPNAFATGAFKNSALVAVSTGLLQNMTHEEVEAVIGHEVGAHRQRRHGHHDADPGCDEHLCGVPELARDRLCRGQLSAQERRSNSSGPGIGYMVTTIVLDIVLGFVAAIIVAWFSAPARIPCRRRCRPASWAASQPMINALARLGGVHTAGAAQEHGRHGYCRGHWQTVFSTHPPIEERIAALQNMQNQG
jgi:heat shock protein HtpX